MDGWQVAEVGQASFTHLRNQLRSRDLAPAFNINLTAVQYADLRKPLYSGITAMLVIDDYYWYILDTDTVPLSVSDQARFWANKYTVNSWTNADDVYRRASTAVGASKSSFHVFSTA